MTTSGRSTQTESEAVEYAADEPTDDTPALNTRDVDGERTVFTEEGNSDGWIATDLTVEPSE